MTADREKIQVARLLVMMYRQGWMDASMYLRGETIRMANSLYDKYKEMLPDDEKAKDASKPKT